MYAFGNMVWATMGPMNELFHEAMENTGDGHRLGGPMLQAREPRARQPRHGHVRSRRSRRDHAAGSQSAGGHPAVGGRRYHRADPRQRHSRLLRVSGSIPAGARRPVAHQAPRSTRACAGTRPRAWPDASRCGTCEIDGYVIPAGRALRPDVRGRQPRSAPLGLHRIASTCAETTAAASASGYGVHACVGRVLALLEAEALLGRV